MMKDVFEILSSVLSVFLGGSVVVMLLTFTNIPEDMLSYLRLGVYIVALVGSILVLHQRYKYFKAKTKNEESKQTDKDRFTFYRDYTKKEE